jgi:O-methyltransferase
MRLTDWMRRSDIIVGAYALLSFYASYLLKDFQKREMKRLFRKVRRHTMVSYKRLRNVYDLAHIAEAQKIKGAFVECGVWKGGCAAVMAYVSKKYGSKREIHLFDSFEGLEDPTEKDGEKALDYMDHIRQGMYASRYRCNASSETVKDLLFNKLEIHKSMVHFHKGWFQTTIPVQKDQIDEIAILRLDSDWYTSTKICLDHLYDKVTDGGFIIIDDYGYWEGCKKAVDEFLSERWLHPEFEKIDSGGYYFVKIERLI